MENTTFVLNENKKFEHASKISNLKIMKCTPKQSKIFYQKEVLKFSQKLVKFAIVTLSVYFKSKIIISLTKIT